MDGFGGLNVTPLLKNYPN